MSVKDRGIGFVIGIVVALFASAVGNTKAEGGWASAAALESIAKDIHSIAVDISAIRQAMAPSPPVKRKITARERDTINGLPVRQRAQPCHDMGGTMDDATCR